MGNECRGQLIRLIFFFFLNVNVLHYYLWTNIIIIIICWTSTYTRSASVFCSIDMHLLCIVFFILQRIHWNEILQKCTCFSFSTNRWANYLLWTRSLFVSVNYQRLLNHSIYHNELVKSRKMFLNAIISCFYRTIWVNPISLTFSKFNLF